MYILFYNKTVIFAGKVVYFAEVTLKMNPVGSDNGSEQGLLNSHQENAIPESLKVSFDSEQQNLNANKPDFVWNDQNGEDNPSSRFGIQIQSARSIDIKDFENMELLESVNFVRNLASDKVAQVDKSAESATNVSDMTAAVALVESDSDAALVSLDLGINNPVQSQPNSETREKDETEHILSSVDRKSDADLVADSSISTSDSPARNQPVKFSEAVKFSEGVSNSKEMAPNQEDGSETNCTKTSDDVGRLSGSDGRSSVSVDGDDKSDDKQSNVSRMENSIQSDMKRFVVSTDQDAVEGDLCEEEPRNVPLVVRYLHNRGQTRGMKKLLGVWQQYPNSGCGVRDVDEPLVKRPSLLRTPSPKKHPDTRYPISNQHPQVSSWTELAVDSSWKPNVALPPPNFPGRTEPSLVPQPPVFHGNGLQVSPPELHLPGNAPSVPFPWHYMPTQPHGLTTMSVPPSGGGYQPFVGVPPPNPGSVPPGFISPGSYAMPSNAFQVPLNLPPPSIPVPPPFGMPQYPSFSGMVSGFPGTFQSNFSSGAPPQDHSYQQWYDWYQQYTQWSQGYGSNVQAEPVVSTSNEEVKSLDGTSSLDVTTPAPVNIVLTGKDSKLAGKDSKRSVLPISSIPLPATIAIPTINVPTNSTEFSAADSSSVEAAPSDVIAEIPNCDGSPSQVSRFRDDVYSDLSETMSDLSSNEISNDKISTNCETVDVESEVSVTQNFHADVGQSASGARELDSANKLRILRRKFQLESKPAKPSSRNRLQNLTSLAASFRADSSVELKDSSEPPTSSVMLWIGNLPVGTKAMEMRTLASRYGKVINCKVGALKSQKDAGLFALVTMETEYDVISCISCLNKTNYNGREIVVRKFQSD